MTSTVIQLTHCVDMETISRLFVRYKGRYGGLWTCRAGSDQEWQWVMEDWLEELSRFSLEVLRSAFKKSLTEFTTAPPTLPQLVELCMKESGIPDHNEVIRAMVARDFNHPIVKMIYDKVGSWTLNHGKSEDIERKVKEHYMSARSEFHIEPKKAWTQLAAYNAKPKSLPAPSKIPSTSESKAFRECMNECHKILTNKNTDIPHKTYKEFDENKIKRGHKAFDQTVFDDYKAYLLSIPEEKATLLPLAYMWDRTRLISQREQGEHLRQAGFVPHANRQSSEPPRSGNGKPTKIYKNWNRD